MNPLTADRLREMLHYEPYTGDWIWLVKPNKNICIGEPAGGRGRGGRSRLRIAIDGKRYFGSRLAVLYMTGEWPAGQVDHFDRDFTNDKWGNLRDATITQNQGNRRINKNNTSGFKGVSWSKQHNKWLAVIQRYGKTRHVGLFSSIEEAANAYDMAAKEYFGAFACLNFKTEQSHASHS
jgi:AP2 domain-containing protein/HNH endonuclease